MMRGQKSQETFTEDDLMRRQNRYKRVMKRRRATTYYEQLTQKLPEPQRILDSTLALLLLVATLPLMVGMRLSCGPIRKLERVGKGCRTFEELSFSVKKAGLLDRLGLYRLPSLWNIVRGEMSFIGPRVVSPGDMSPRERVRRERYAVRPGIFCLHWVRRRTNIAFDPEEYADREYVQQRTLLGDLGVALRSAWTAFYGETHISVVNPGRISILDLPVNNVTMEEAVTTLAEQALSPTRSLQQVSFLNADCANIANRNDSYRHILQSVSDYNLADGIGMKIAGNLLKRPIRENVNGTDLFPRLCATLSDTSASIYLLGAKPGVADGVANWVTKNYPGVRIAGVRHGYFDSTEEAEVLEAIRHSKATVLLVAFGAPHQEKWIADHRHELGEVRVAMAVGGLFDFYSGMKQRAPQWLRELGMEWVFRLLLEPGRLWKRYVVGNSLFLMRVLITRLMESWASHSSKSLSLVSHPNTAIDRQH